MKKKILFFVLFIFVSLFSIFLLLKNGIFISNIQFDFLKLDKLYIKLDKKLILKADSIFILGNKDLNDKKNQFDSKIIVDISKKLNYLYLFVDEIDIQKLVVNNDDFRVLFKDGIFFVDSNKLFVELRLTKNERDLIGNIESLILKDYDLNLFGYFKLNTKSNFYNFNIQANGSDIDFNGNFLYKDYKLYYRFDDLNITNIKNIANKINKNFKINEQIDDWVFKKATGNFYHLDYIQGFIDFKKENYYLNDIKLSGFVKDVRVVLGDGLKPIEIPLLNLNLNNQKLDFDFEKASYLNYDLSRSKVYLFDLFDEKKAGISINLVSNFLMLDNEIQKILKLYDINIPFIQKQGKINANLLIKIVFDKIDKDIFYEGDFNITKSTLDIANFYIEKADLRLKDNKAILSNAFSNNDFFKSNFSANIDLKNKNGIFDLNISEFVLPANLIDIKNQNVKVEFDYKDKVKAFLPEYNISFNFDDGFRIDFLDFALLKPYSKILQKINFQRADSIYLFTKNFSDFEMAFKNVEFDVNLYKLDKSKYNKDSFFVIKNQNNLQISSSSDLINIIKNNNQVNIALNSLSLEYALDDKEDINFKDVEEDIIVNARDISLILKDLNKTLDFDEFQAFINKNTISANARTNYATFDFLSAPGKFNLNINNAKEQNINTFFQKNVVANGDFNMSIIGESSKSFKGKIEFKNTFIKDLKSYNQLISFIDTIPSLLLFKSPTFNNEGLSVKNASIIFIRDNDDLKIKALKINGDSVDAYGLGDINLKNDTLNLNLELRTFKSASKAISSIPIIKYIFLGDKKQISTALKIEGTINNPKFKTQVLEDTIKTPFNLIKNIFTLPINLIK